MPLQFLDTSIEPVTFPHRVKGLAMSAGGELLFSASSDGAIKTWRIHEPLVGDRSAF